MTAVVRHRETGVPMRAPTGRQNRLAIHLKFIHDVGALSNLSSGTLSVWCNTIDAMYAVREVACAYGATDIRVSNTCDTAHSGATVNVEVAWPGDKQ